MKAKKLPSGSWHIQVYSYTDSNGKMHRESFTAPTKAEVELLASEFKAKKHRTTRGDLTVAESLEKYIQAKEAVLSPSTIREYKRILKNDSSKLMSTRVKRLTTEDLQLYVSELSKTVSPKTVKNRYALLTAAIGLYCPDLSFKVTMPARQVKRPQMPSDDVVRHIYSQAKPRLRKIIALAMCGLRRGEIAALKYEDIFDGIAHIHADIVQDSEGKWIYKETAKTAGSDRFVYLPDSVLELIGKGKGFIIDINPNSIGQAYKNLARRLGYDTSLHQLRHYYASTGASLKVPDIILADFGGWTHSSKVMKDTYQHSITNISEHYARKINRHLDKIIRDAK